MSATPPVDFPHHIFKAYDIRGAAHGDSAELTADLMERIGRALGVAARQHGANQFVIGRDGRLTGPTLAAALARGVCASGCDVTDIGLTPTPVLYFACGAAGLDTGAGAQVTASHNPPGDNGVKMLAGGNALYGDGIQQLKQHVMADDFNSPSPIGTVRERDMLTPYRQAVAAGIRCARALKIVVDCGNGAAGVIAPKVLREIGCEVVELFCEVDGAFPNHHPDPSCAENLQDLIAAVKQHNADFGIAFDGDGDRLGVVSNDGAIIWPDRLMLLFAEGVLRDLPGAEIIFDVKCSRLLPQAIESGGGVATMCRTGHSFIKEQIKKTGAPLAGEMSGHIFFNDRWGGFDDGLYAAARLCEILAADSRRPAEVFAALPDSINTPELKLPLPEGEPHKLVELLQAAAAAEFADAAVSTIDGIRADFSYGFGLIRASNTTPALIMRFEADTQKQLAAIQSRFRKLLQAAGCDARLPF